MKKRLRKYPQEKLTISLILATFFFSLATGAILGGFIKRIKVAQIRAYQAKKEAEQRERVERLVKKMELGIYKNRK